MRAVALLLLLCACAQLSSAQWLRCNFAQDTNVSIVLTPQNCVNETGHVCLDRIYPGLPITFGECIVNDNPPQRGRKANIQVFYNFSQAGDRPEIDFQDDINSQGYYFSDWINDMFFVYWNETGVNETFGENQNNLTLLPQLKLDALGNSLGRFRIPVQEHQVEIMVANYITRLGAEGEIPAIQVVVGDMNGNDVLNQTVWYAGYGVNYLNRIITNYSEMIPIRIYGPGDCIGFVPPLWYGYINATNIHNETVIAFFGDYVTGDVYALYGRRLNFTENLMNTPYMVCNFVNEVDNGTVIGMPEDMNFTVQLGAMEQKQCGFLDHTIQADRRVPYGTCQVMHNGPAPRTTFEKIVWLGRPLLLLNGSSSNSTLNNTLTRNAGIMIVNQTMGVGQKQAMLFGDGKDFLIAYYVDHYEGRMLNNSNDNDNDTNYYTLEHPREDAALIYQTRCFMNGSLCTDVINTVINSTWTPSQNQTTYIIGTYASNYMAVSLNATDFNFSNPNAGLNASDVSNVYVTVAFNNRWWTVCPVSTYDWRSCVITVPFIEDVYNITLYSAPCYVNTDGCPEYYLSSTLVNFGNASVGLVAWYGDWNNETFVVKYNQFGVLWNVTEAMGSVAPSSSSSSTGGISSSSSSSSSSSTGVPPVSSSTGGASSSTAPPPLSSSSSSTAPPPLSSSSSISSSSTGAASSSSSTGALSSSSSSLTGFSSSSSSSTGM